MKKQIKELKQLAVAYKVANAFDGYCLPPEDLSTAKNEVDGVTKAILDKHQGSSSDELARTICRAIEDLND